MEKDKERERRAQLETMEAEVSNFKAAKAKENMADLTRVEAGG